MYNEPYRTRFPLVNVMIEAAYKAGRHLVRDFGEVENLQISRKGPSDFVTASDKRAERIISDTLTRARPDFSLLLEESGHIENDPKHLWIVDPLDGTNNFLHGFPHFCISIAYASHQRLRAGVIYDPLRDELFWADYGNGAFLLNKKLSVSSRSEVESCLMLQEQCGQQDRIRLPFPSIRHTGSSALDLAYVAAGRADGFVVHHAKPWDLAAGILLVAEAKGSVQRMDRNNDEDEGYSPLYEATSLIASNTHIHPQLVRALNEL